MSRSNVYGLDFLRREHTLDEQEDADGKNREEDGEDEDQQDGPFKWASTASAASGIAVARKSDLEKQFDVIHFLQAHRSAGCLAPSVIYQNTGIDLLEEEKVAEWLQHNPKIRVDHVPDPENPSLMIATYAYQAKYNHVRDRTTLLAQINQCKNGVARRDLEDCYDGVEDDLDALIAAGDVLAIANTEDKDKIIFPRGEAFLVELDGIISIPEPKKSHPASSNSTHNTAVNGSPSKTSTAKSNGNMTNGKNNVDDDASKRQQPDIYIVETDVDPLSQIRRGEAVCVGGQWFRVSSAVKDGPIKDQPARAQAPLSVVSLTDLSKRNEQDGYIRPFSEKLIPLDGALSPAAVDNIQRARKARERLLKVAHGRSGGVASQLLGNYAHSSNPTTLAASFGTTSAGSRERPNNAGPLSEAHKHDVLQAQEAASDPALALYSHARRHGCTKDVREMYLATRDAVPESEIEFKNLLIEHKLLEPDEQLRRERLPKKANVDNDGKPKKRRYYERKNQRMTNTHLEGTEIGAVLRRATEKQKQGEQVGDGGM